MVGTLALSLLGAVAPAGAADVVIARAGTLARDAGQPVPADPGRRIVSASVRHDLVEHRLLASIRLAGPPSAGIGLGVGRRSSAGTCALSHVFTSGYTVDGASVSFDLSPSVAINATWTCAAVVTSTTANPPPYDDAFVGNLRDVTRPGPRPRLAITKVRLLELNRIALVPGQWTVLDVEVANRAADAHAPRVRLTGKGRGVAVRPAGYGEIFDGRHRTRRVMVKLTRRARATLVLTARSGNVTAKRRVAVRPAAAPPRPRAGAYRVNVKGRQKASFRIAKGRVTKFRVFAQTACGGYPDPSMTYSFKHYDFPTTRIPRNGIVDREISTRGRAGYTVRLRMLVRGGKVTRGSFEYAGVAAQCRASVDFSARRR